MMASHPVDPVAIELGKASLAIVETQQRIAKLAELRVVFKKRMDECSNPECTHRVALESLAAIRRLNDE